MKIMGWDFLTFKSIVVQNVNTYTHMHKVDRKNLNIITLRHHTTIITHNSFSMRDNSVLVLLLLLQ